MKARLEEQKGLTDSYALFYGPLMFVANLGTQKGDIYYSTAQHQTYKYGIWTSFDGPYTGNIVQTLIIEGFDKNKINDYITRKVVDGKLVLTISASNQTVDFIPWIDCIFQRYSMYMYYKSK
jgi:hypothetical protein